MLKKRNLAKKGQDTANAAVLLALVTIFIIIYILALPTDIRDDLLNETVTSPFDYFIGDGGTQPEPIYVNIGSETSIIETQGEEFVRLYKGKREKDYEFSYLHLRAVDEPIDFFSKIDSIYLKSSLFDRKQGIINFELANPEYASGLFLTFDVKERYCSGRLIVNLNGNEILNTALSEIDSSGQSYCINDKVIDLDPKLLRENNRLSFSVSGVGAAFWKKNEYIIEEVMMKGYMTNLDGQSGEMTFYVYEDDVPPEQIKEITLSYTIGECDESSVLPLEVIYNDNIISSKIPDCGGGDKHIIEPELLTLGRNVLKFRTTKGNYFIGGPIRLTVYFKKAKDYTYKFTLDEEIFEETSDLEFCGKPDGKCPGGCTEDEDPDCCFRGSRDNFWCDIETTDEDDRCARAITNAKCLRCLSGYEDESGDAPENCENKCGDDEDDICPPDCNVYYDKDCCYAQSGDQYWCDDVPLSGVTSICEWAISEYECDDCFEGYEGEDHSPSCPSKPNYGTESKLRDNYDIDFEITFVDDGKGKEANLIINGHQIYLDTSRGDFDQIINSYVVPNNNYIRIEPKTDLDIIDIKIDVRS
ncbi:hypothetical protein ACFL1H_07300 [Nanoarchaeota archaeon]